MGKFDSFAKFARDCAIACAPMVAEKSFNRLLAWKKERDAQAQKLLDVDIILNNDSEKKE